MKASWEVVADDGSPHGIAVDAKVVSLWSGRPPADIGTSITHPKFLKGGYQGQVAERFGCGVLLEVIAAARLVRVRSQCPYCGSRYELEDTADNSEYRPVFHLRRVSQGDRG